MPFCFSSLLPWNWRGIRNDLAAAEPAPGIAPPFAIVHGMPGCQISPLVRTELANLSKKTVVLLPLPIKLETLKISRHIRYHFLILSKALGDVEDLKILPQNLFKGVKLMVLKDGSSPIDNLQFKPEVKCSEEMDLKRLKSFNWDCELDMLLIENFEFNGYQVRRIHQHFDLPLPQPLAPLPLVKRLNLAQRLSEAPLERGSQLKRKSRLGIPSVENVSDSPHTPNTPQSANSSFIPERTDRLVLELKILEKRLIQLEYTVNQLIMAFQIKGSLPPLIVTQSKSEPVEIPLAQSSQGNSGIELKADGKKRIPQ